MFAGFLRQLLRAATRPARRKPKKAAPGFWQDIDDAAKRQTQMAALPPGAEEDWLIFVRQERGGRAWRQNFQPFVIEFDYEDGEGGRSARRLTVAVVRVETYDGTVRPGVVMAYGWCHDKREPRTFRADRMSNLRDPASDEIPQDARAWLLKRSQGRHR